MLAGGGKGTEGAKQSSDSCDTGHQHTSGNSRETGGS